MSRGEAATGAPPGRLALRAGVLAAAVAAWLVLASSGSHQPAGHVGHSHPDPGAGVTLARAAGVWLLMVVAMMLPPALPLLDLVRRLVAGRPRPGRLVAVAAAAFVAVWLAAGAVLALGTAMLRSLLDAAGWTAGRSTAALGAGLLIAGGYQFTPLKNACLRACRSPRGFAVAHWQGRRAAPVEAAALAGAYGAFCVGCCWALMAVGLLVGVAALPAMAGLAVLMAAERLWRHGRGLVRPVGLAAIIAGAAVLLDLTRLVPPA